MVGGEERGGVGGAGERGGRGEEWSVESEEWGVEEQGSRGAGGQGGGGEDEREDEGEELKGEDGSHRCCSFGQDTRVVAYLLGGRWVGGGGVGRWGGVGMGVPSGFCGFVVSFMSG